MLGTSKTVVEKATKEWEFMKIEVRETEIMFTPFLNGVEVKPFHLNSKESNANKLVFENFQNEFPKQIIYTKKTNQLGIQLTGDSKIPTIQYDLPSVSCTK